MNPRPSVYVAHPMTSYGTPHAGACLDALAVLLPGTRLIDPAAVFASDAEWQRSWPGLVRTLGGFVVFGDESGTIGAGCVRELADAVGMGVQVGGFDIGRGLRHIRGLNLFDRTLRSPRRMGTMRLGRTLTSL